MNIISDDFQFIGGTARAFVILTNVRSLSYVFNGPVPIVWMNTHELYRTLI